MSDRRLIVQGSLSSILGGLVVFSVLQHWPVALAAAVVAQGLNWYLLWRDL